MSLRETVSAKKKKRSWALVREADFLSDEIDMRVSVKKKILLSLRKKE